MSGYSRQDNRSAARKSDGKMKHTNRGSGTKWKPKAKVPTDGSLGSVSCCQRDNSSLAGECVSGKLSNFSPKPDNGSKPLGSVFTLYHSSNESLTVSSESDPSRTYPIKAKSHHERRSDAAMEDRIPEIGKADGSGTPAETDRASCLNRFDICPKRADSVIRLKPPLHVKNKEKRNQLKRSAERENISILRPGMVLMKGYISCDEQINIVKTCRELGFGDGGFYQPGYRDGAKLHLKMMCLGKNWDPGSGEYGDSRPIDNSKPPGIPDKFHGMVKRAIQDSNAHFQKKVAKENAGKIIPSMSPDICIVNFYTKSGKLGLHQDKDESRESINRGLPVVSFSIGDSAKFLYGDARDMDKADEVILESGDVLIFGGKSRLLFHGVASVIPDSAPVSLLEATDMCPGRLNLTFRQY